ncbi:MAG: hypothetical protein LBK59_08890 [Bifidobacteriaceae bacterium]|nr:hypothetical protein [Bifidobacteriaceae bacterium]
MSWQRSWRQVAWIALKWVAGVVFVVFLGIAIAQNWTQVRGAMDQLPPANLAASIALAGLALTFSGLQQHSLLAAFGASSIGVRGFLGAFFLAQLGKYAPGTGLAYVAQMELSRTLGVRRAASVVAMALGAGMTILLAVCFGGVLIGSDTVRIIPLWLQVATVVLAALSLLALMVRPALVSRFLAAMPVRPIRSQFADVHLPSPAPAVAWSAAAWIAYGLHLAFLLFPYVDDGGAALRAAMGGFPLAWVVGFLAVIVPAGVGVREAVLAAVLDPLAGAGVALTVAALSRFAIIIAEALLAGAGAVVRWPRRRAG